MRNGAAERGAAQCQKDLEDFEPGPFGVSEVDKLSGKRIIPM